MNAETGCVLTFFNVYFAGVTTIGYFTSNVDQQELTTIKKSNYKTYPYHCILFFTNHL